jgi:hypothetical protein
VLRRGSAQSPLYSDGNVVVLARRLGDTWALTASNNATAARTVSVPMPEAMRELRWTDALASEPGAPGPLTGQGALEVEIPALGGRVLVSR